MPEQWYPVAEPEKGVIGRFEYFDILDVKASREADEEVYMPAIICRTKAVGSTDDTCVKVKPYNKDALIRRFPAAWKAFQGEEIKVDGTPIEKLGFSTTENDTLLLNSIQTVEQLAELSDMACQNIGFGTRKRRDIARDYLEHGADALPHNKAAKGTDPAPKNRRGRPPRTAEAEQPMETVDV